MRRNAARVPAEWEQLQPPPCEQEARVTVECAPSLQCAAEPMEGVVGSIADETEPHLVVTFFPPAATAPKMPIQSRDVLWKYCCHQTLTVT